MSKQLIDAHGVQPPQQLLPLHKNSAFTPSQSRQRSWRNLIVTFLLLLVSIKVSRDYLAPLVLRELSSYDHDPHFSDYVRRRTPSYTHNPAYIVEAKNGAVATENFICSELGVDILKKGGNAVDAVVTTTLCIGVVSMFS